MQMIQMLKDHQRRVFSVDVGDMSVEELTNCLNNVKAEIDKTKLIVGQASTINFSVSKGVAAEVSESAIKLAK